MKHILLFFLSDIHLTPGHEFQHSIYTGQDGESFDCIQTNESAVDYLMAYLAGKQNTLDALFYFSSNLTRENLRVTAVGNTIEKTHEEWFRQRLKEKYPLLQDNFYGIPYDETKDTDESIRQVVLMAERIKKYLTAFGEEEIYLHADMTGGFRHASMMMLSVMQLLKFSGIHIGKVVYSNWQRGVIEDVTEVHRMFTLVSGTDEFVNFGSVKEIERYFENRPKSKSLEALLTTMRDFSGAVKICRTNKIEEVVKHLQYRIKAFSEETEKSVYERIFAQIITVLQEEYGNLLMNDVTKIDIIEWCIRKGFLQQAMTLCTEWLPFVLVEKKICYTDDEFTKLEALKLGESMQRAWEQTFIISYFKGEAPLPVISKSDLKGYHAAISHYIEYGDAEDGAALYPPGNKGLLALFTECKERPDIFAEIRNLSVAIDTFAEMTPLLEKACKLLWRLRKETNHTNLGYEAFVSQKIVDTVHCLKQIQTFPETYQNELLDIKKEEKTLPCESADIKQNRKSADAKKTGWENRCMQYQSMLDNGIMQTNYPDKVIDMLKGFYEIRTERNRINHAASDRESEIQETENVKSPEELMMGYLAKLKMF